MGAGWWTALGALWLAALLVAVLSIVAGTLATGIAPMPSSRRACQAMIAAARAAPDGPVVDLGAGWGLLAIRAARALPQRKVIGYEVSPLPWAVAWTLGRLLGLRNLSLRRSDFREADLDHAAVLMCYLFRDGMTDLARRLAGRRRRPQVVISNSFALPGHVASRVERLPDLQRTRILVYRLRG